ncbi:uncharacterized protein [Primulina eburnea]|uniref:uncharacterized protein isoform X2 n=1 Tax=Primulina eburnea TaxID=1245227 RepID=UPI003C6BFB2A
MEKDEGKKSRNKYSADKITLEHFVSTMVPLIDMEKETEISVSMNSGAMRSLDIAQKKGSTILNLKCVDAQTGLLGKSLLEFHSNKGDVLPPHRVTYRRMKDTLIQLSKGVPKGPAADLVPVLFGERLPTVSKKDIKFTPVNYNLYSSQWEIL